MHLLDLPNELLREIFKYLSPRKIRKISHVCRDIYSQVYPLKMDNFFASVQVGSGSTHHWHGYGRKPSDVLSKFLNDPASRTYVKSLIFGGIDYDGCRTVANDRVIASVARTRVVGSPTSQRKHRTWMHTLQQRDSEDLSFAQLLSVIPNLGELKMCGMPGQRSRRMIKTLADNAIISGGLLPLPKLKKAAYSPPYQWHCTSRASKKRIRLDMKLLAILAAVPSLKSLHISDLSTHYDEFLIWPNGPCSSSVENLTLDECTFNTTFFASLISEFQNLRVFRYHSHSSALYQPSSLPGWEPGALAKAFSANTKRLLETLDTRGCWQWYTRDAFRNISSANYNPIPPLLNHFIGPLQGFQALKYIFINYILLLNHGIPCPLIKILPKSVEKVALVSHMKWWKTSEPLEISMEIFLEGLPEEKMIMLPHLKQIMLDEPETVVQTPLRSGCEEVGVRITKYVWEQDSEC